MKIQVSILTIGMCVIMTAMGNIKLYLGTYLIMSLHESAHLIAALLLGLKPESIKFSPFGVNLKLKNKIIYSLADEIILYISGPLINAVLSIVALYSGDVLLYKLNIGLLVMNILPVMPLDGGMIFKRLLLCRFSEKQSTVILRVTSIVIGVIVCIFAFISILYNNANITLFLISVLLIGNALTHSNFFDSRLIRSLNCQKKRTNKVKFILLDNDKSILEAVNSFSPEYTTCGILNDKSGEFKKIVSEKEMLNMVNTE